MNQKSKFLTNVNLFQQVSLSSNELENWEQLYKKNDNSLFPYGEIKKILSLDYFILVKQKFMAKDDDSVLYVRFHDLSICKVLIYYTLICKDLLAVLIDINTSCEAQPFTKFILSKGIFYCPYFPTGWNIEHQTQV